MMAACTAGWAWMAVAERYFSVPHGISFPPQTAVAWWMVVLIPVAGGVAEDVTHRLGARWRLALSLCAGAAAVWLLDVQISRFDIRSLDAVWRTSYWAPFLLAALAITGLPHAFNLIDGYNGLAGIVAAVCCLAIAHVAMQLGDRQLAAVMLVLAGATAGFLVWNYPRGLIFAGDGGAYLWGVVIAVASIQLVQRHPQVSPWFPMLLLIYPVWETVFSIYRKLARGQSPGLADALHFHQLIYRRIVRGVFDDNNEARRMLMRNNRTSPYLWGFTLLTVVPAVLFWQNTVVLMAFCGLFVVSYLYAYISIVRFKVPRWLRR
jgi:UDP-GlcNAc:undecaprenyl-phosphate/decaprenyl-phosphate GlcNAc-1-phosphate transferase